MQFKGHQASILDSFSKESFSPMQALNGLEKAHLCGEEPNAYEMLSSPRDAWAPWDNPASKQTTDPDLPTFPR